MAHRSPSRAGELVRRHRIAAALSQEALAERAGLSGRAISDLERGVHLVPRLESLRLLADALGLNAAGRAELLATAHPHRAVPRSHDRPRSLPPAWLPVPPTRLIGREIEVAQVARLLTQDAVRLVTLTGPGGIGKTRLALQVAAQLLDAFPDGVFYVELSPLTDPLFVVPAIAAALGIHEVGGQPLLTTLSRVLAPKQLLLLLDNCEHVLAAAPEVATLLATSPSLSILATSRAALHIRGEREFPLPPLPVPATDRLPPFQELTEVPAVALFVDLATASWPDFALTTDNSRAVAAICQRLDGLPLAIELAAARVKVLPPAALLARLEHRLPLLTGGSRDLPARHRTMRDAIAWSYDLLDPDDQRLFRQLSVFVGGFTLDAAEVVAAPDADRPLLDGVVALVEQSLLRQIPGVGDEPRYQMLEMVREYGLERREANGEGHASRSRHAACCLALLERADPSVYNSTSDQAWLEVIDRDYDNVRTALAWAWEAGQHDILLRLAGGLIWWWYYRGHLSEGRRWLSQALQSTTDEGGSWRRAWALTGSGLLAHVCGEPDHAAELLTASFGGWERSGIARGTAIARSLLGGVRLSQGQYDQAAALFAANETYLRESGDEIWLAHARFHLGVIAWVQGDEAGARGLLREAVAHSDRSGWPADAIDALRYLGLIACAAGDPRDAARWFGEAWTRLRPLGNRAALAVGLADVATLATACEAWQSAVRLFATAEALLQDEAAALSWPAREHYERARGRARDALGVAASAEESAGRALALEEVVTVAEAVLERHHAEPGSVYGRDGAGNVPAC
jgi:predicted ATPase/transcriptional regulator with XRE-family HTH domain